MNTMEWDFTVREMAEKISFNWRHLTTGKQVWFSCGHKRMICVFSAWLKVIDFAPSIPRTNVAGRSPSCHGGMYFSTENKYVFLEQSKQGNVITLGYKVPIPYKEMIQVFNHRTHYMNSYEETQPIKPCIHLYSHSSNVWIF